MLFNPFRKSQPIFSPRAVTSSWWVVWGKLDSQIENIIWRDEQFALVSPLSSTEFALDPSEKFVVIGDVWLTNQSELLEKLQIQPSGFEGTAQNLVARLWQKWGVECLGMLVGMFGLVVWDRQQQQMWLGRDRIGGRTLYYTNSGTVRWIAPQLRSLHPQRTNELDLVALRDYLCCAFVPGERTLWRDVREVRPGSWIQFPTEQVYPYWTLQEQVTPLVGPLVEPLEWYGDRLRCLLEQVVEEYLPENQPVGVFLSGGLDSSSITALAAQFHHAPVHTYSIHFGVETPSELEFSSLVAEHCQTQHHILEITLKDMWELLPETMQYLDDPIGDPLTVPNFLVGRMAREHVQVVLNGEGGDPCFGGPKNQPMLINSLYNSVSHLDSLQAYLSAFQKCAVDLPQLLKPEIWEAVQTEPSLFLEDLNSNVSYLNRLMVLNIKFKGADQILTKVNNLTQAVGLSGRSPLFDQRVVDWSMQIPPEYKLSGVREKAVLKQAMNDILPQRIIHRPKSGMMVPVQLGFRKYWQREARKLLLNKRSAISAYINPQLMRDWLDFQGDIWGRYGVKLWLLVSLEVWLQVNRK